MKTNMVNRILFIALALIFLGGMTSYALKPITTSSVTIQNLLEESLQYPEKAVRECYTGSVDVLFKINDDHTIMIRNISCDNENIACCVKEQLSKISFKDIKNTYNQYYKIRITFKTE